MVNLLVRRVQQRQDNIRHAELETREKERINNNEATRAENQEVNLNATVRFRRQNDAVGKQGTRAKQPTVQRLYSDFFFLFAAVKL